MASPVGGQGALMSNLTTDLWSFLPASSLFWLVATLAVYCVAVRINRWAKGSPLVHPVLICLLLLIPLLLLTKTRYNDYFAGAQFLHVLLGPAIVALAIPVYDQRALVRRLWLPILGTCVLGASTAILSAVGLTLVLGGSAELAVAMSPKSVTTPMALGIAEQIGASPALVAGLVLLTGVSGCIVAPFIFRWFPNVSGAAKGFALGVSAHGFGTAQALQTSALMGAMAGIGVALTGVFTAFILPLLMPLLS